MTTNVNSMDKVMFISGGFKGNHDSGKIIRIYNHTNLSSSEWFFDCNSLSMLLVYKLNFPIPYSHPNSLNFSPTT